MKKSTKSTKVKLIIPKRCKGDNERFIACNGKRILVKTGCEVELDPDIAEVYRNSEEQREAACRRIAGMVSI